MANLSFREKIEMAPPGSFHVLEPAKAKKLKGATMYVPSPEDMRIAILEIPAGETRELTEIRQDLAAKNNAEITCPAMANKYWKWVAWAADENPSDAKYGPVPYWRVLKDGKTSDKLPGGAEFQIQKLSDEGVQLKSQKR